eukprot:351323-Chlamydomonas_euryale.AAC.16
MSSSPTCGHASQQLGLDWVASAMVVRWQGAERSSKHVHVDARARTQACATAGSAGPPPGLVIRSCHLTIQ